MLETQTERLQQLETLTLLSGSHPSFDDGVCAMEAVAWLAGEPHSDEPTCACPVLSVFMRSWNDGITDTAERTRLLRPQLPRLIGTRSTAAVAEQRSYMALDWLIRVHTPEWMSLKADLKVHAETLRGLSPIVDMSSANAAGPKVRAARAAAWAAARAAAWDAAWDAARDAAWAAAWAAAREYLRPTKDRLQVSAIDLFERMLAVR